MFRSARFEPYRPSYVSLRRYVYHRLSWIGKDVTFMSNTWVIVLSVVAGVAVVGALMSIVTALVINRRHRRIAASTRWPTWAPGSPPGCRPPTS